MDLDMRSFIENSYDEGMKGSQIANALRKEPYNLKISHMTVLSHCRECKFLKEEVKEKRDDDVKHLNDFIQRQQLAVYRNFAIDSSLLDDLIDPLKRAQELFFLNYTRFIDILSEEKETKTWKRETIPQMRELRELLMLIGRLSGDVQDNESVKEIQVLQLLVKSYDGVEPSTRSELIKTLEELAQSESQEALAIDEVDVEEVENNV